MKKQIAAAFFFILAAAANATSLAPNIHLINPITDPITKGSGINIVAHNTEPGVGKGAIVSEAAHTRNRLKKLLKLNKTKSNLKKEDELITGMQEINLQQGPATPQDQVNQNNPQEVRQEVKSIPRARRVEKPAKVEGSAKRPDAGSAKRSTMTAGRPNQAVNPNQAAKAPRAGRPTGAGRPAGAGKPAKIKGPK